jgi:hypothetical protein
VVWTIIHVLLLFAIISRSAASRASTTIPRSP